MLHRRNEILSRTYLQNAVGDYVLHLNRECLDRLIMQIKLDTFGFFHLRNPQRSAFETLMLFGRTSELKHAAGFLCHLFISGINPLVVCNGIDNRALDLSISIIKKALQAGLLNFDDYLKFYTNAIESLYSDDNQRSRQIYYLLSSLQFERATPLSLAIKYFPAHLVRPVFLVINDMYFTHNGFSRENYRHILTAADSYGLTPLHYALRRPYPTALVDLYAAMSLILTHEEHVHFNEQHLADNSYVDWIAFYGTLALLNGYIAFLTENLRTREMTNILIKQSSVNHPLRLRYDHDTELSQAIIRILQPQPHQPSRNIFNFKLFSFPHIPCDGLQAGRTRNKAQKDRRRQLNP